VPGSTNANSRNSTSGQHAPIAITTHPMTASPTDWAAPERWDLDVSARVASALLGGVTPLEGQA